MSDFLDRLVRRGVDASASTLQPRLPSLFEPAQPGVPDPALAPRATATLHEADGPAPFEVWTSEHSRRSDVRRERAEDARAEETRREATRPSASGRQASDEPTFFAAETGAEDAARERGLSVRVGESDETRASRLASAVTRIGALLSDEGAADEAREAREGSASRRAEETDKTRASQLAAAVARVGSLLSDEDAARDAARSRAATSGAGEGVRDISENGSDNRAARDSAASRRVVTPAVVSREPVAPRRAANVNAAESLSADAAPTIVRVTIGRVEVRAVAPPASQPAQESPRKSRAPSSLSLEDYLKQRNRGTR